tara:strand:- start:4212 stop:4868 length:657 start_codon:yes stop_codon:yes gene_type:complete
MKSKDNEPINHLNWIYPKKNEFNSKKFDIIFIENYYDWFKNNILKNINGNILQIGGGSGLISVILSKFTNELIVLDYSLNMLNIVKKTIKLNLNSSKNIKFVEEKIENYTELSNIDNIIFTYSMSFSDVNKTIKNLDKNCKIGCKIFILESFKPFIQLMRTDLIKKDKKYFLKWKNNSLKIEKLLDNNKNWKKISKKKIIHYFKSENPVIILNYIKIK